MKAFKNRRLNLHEPVEFYRCLIKKGKVYSIRQNGLVVAHTNKIVLTNCEMVVNTSGKNRCLETGERNVHAFIRGHIGNTDSILNTFSFVVNYHPFSKIGFYTHVGEELIAVEKAKVVYTEENNLYFQI